MYRIYEGRLVQARVVSVADKVIRVEAFGVETRIVARAITPDWLGSAHDHYHVGDKILIRIQKIARESLEALSIEADVRSVTDNAPRDVLKKVRVLGKYAASSRIFTTASCSSGFTSASMRWHIPASIPGRRGKRTMWQWSSPIWMRSAMWQLASSRGF